jgi:spore coat protein CotF
MEEKVMVADTLHGMNSNLSSFGTIIPQTENKELKQAFKQIRNQSEMSQEELYTIAKNKGYYVPAAMATPEEIKQVKNIFI